MAVHGGTLNGSLFRAASALRGDTGVISVLDIYAEVGVEGVHGAPNVTVDGTPSSLGARPDPDNEDLKEKNFRRWHRKPPKSGNLYDGRGDFNELEIPEVAPPDSPNKPPGPPVPVHPVNPDCAYTLTAQCPNDECPSFGSAYADQEYPCVRRCCLNEFRQVTSCDPCSRMGMA